MVTVDGYDIKSKWKLEPKEGGFYDPIMQYYELKERLAQNFKDTNGVVVSLTAPKAKAREFNLSFICDKYVYADAFVNYIISRSFFILEEFGHINEALKLQYQGCSNFNYYTNYITFDIKVKEIDPTNKTNTGVFNNDFDESFDK